MIAPGLIAPAARPSRLISPDECWQAMSRRSPRQTRRVGYSPTGINNSWAISGSTSAWRSDLGITTVSGKVSVWADQSGHANDASQATAGNRPVYNASGGLNNLPYVQFDATTFLAHSLSQAGAGTTVFFVGKVTTAGSYRGVLTLGNGGLWVYAQLSTAVWGYFGNVDIASTHGLSAEKACIVLSTQTNSCNFRTSGAVDVNNSGTAYFTGPTTSLGTGTAGSEAMQGNLYECTVWNRILTTPECQQLEAYSLARYGV